MYPKFFSPIRTVTCGLALIAAVACAENGTPQEVQSLETQSGDFGIPATGKVIAVDLVRASTTDPRFSFATGLVALDIYASNKPDTTGERLFVIQELTSATAAEIETFIRSSLCIYSIDISNDPIGFLHLQLERDLIGEDGSALDAIRDAFPPNFDLFPPAEQQRIYERLLDGAETVSIERELTTISIASQCLTNVGLGDEVGIAKLRDLMVILPRRHSKNLVAEAR